MELDRNVGLSFSRTEFNWSRKAAFASALLLGLLAGCGGGGETVEQAAGAAQAANAPKATIPAQQGPDAVDQADTEQAAVAAQEDLEPAEEQQQAQRAALLRAPAALAESGRAPLGVNLEGVSDWSRLQPFVDMMKTARPWGTLDAPWMEGATVDALGWPTGDAGVFVNVRTFEPGDEGQPYRYLPRGVYKLKFKGSATVGTTSVSVAINNYRYDAATNRSTADVVVGARADAIMLTFRNTRNGVKNVSLRRPGYAPSETFTNEFKQALSLSACCG